MATDKPPVELTRGDVMGAFWRWTFFSHSNYNYERLQGTAFAHMMTPVIRRLYTDPEEIKAALRRHLVFFNTEPNVGSVIHGAVIAMEEQRANGADIDDDGINSVKSGLMGPLAGVGDTITQGTIIPILLSIGIGMAQAGNILGPILYFVLMMIIMTGLTYFMFIQGYTRGRTGVTEILRSGLMDRVITGAGVLGNIVLGALTAQFVAIYIAPSIYINELRFNFQETLDDVMPGLVPLLFTILTWWLLAKKGVNPILLLVVYLLIALVGAVPFFGPAGQCGSSIFNAFYACPPPEASSFLVR
ncbi:MAG: PTS system mannose/fructose/sorbose family transporter subunit IID [Chloroflexi bacterium]|nr:PTS system mannose/fructose/sorbose family transporter subunit IID [Chloroflexota bacterium]